MKNTTHRLLLMMLPWFVYKEKSHWTTKSKRLNIHPKKCPMVPCSNWLDGVDYKWVFFCACDNFKEYFQTSILVIGRWCITTSLAKHHFERCSNRKMQRNLRRCTSSWLSHLYTHQSRWRRLQCKFHSFWTETHFVQIMQKIIKPFTISGWFWWSTSLQQQIGWSRQLGSSVSIIQSNVSIKKHFFFK